MSAWMFEAELWDRATGARWVAFKARVAAPSWFLARVDALKIVARQSFELWGLKWEKLDD